MVLENNVKKVVTLCHKIGDRGASFSHSDPDACQYFPNSATEALDQIVLNDYSIVNKKEQTDQK